jgi:ferredoxin
MMKASEACRRNDANHKAKRTAFVTDACTGCGGAPVCMTFCGYGALMMVRDTENYPFSKIVVDTLLCRGCGSCMTNGKNGVRLTGCPWDAIQLVGTFADKGGI